MSTNPATYQMDLAFSSNVQQLASGVPIRLLGYGWSQSAPTAPRGWQKAKKQIPTGVQFYFVAFDSEPPLRIKSLQFVIEFQGSNPLQSQQTKMTAQSNNGEGETPVYSYGCNIIGGSNWIIGPYTVGNTQGRYQFKVTLNVVLNDGNDTLLTYEVFPREFVVQNPQ